MPVTPLSDEDVDRIARRVVWKLIVYGLLILAVVRRAIAARDSAAGRSRACCALDLGAVSPLAVISLASGV